MSKTDLTKKTDKDLEKLQTDIQKELDQRKHNDLVKKLRDHMNSVEGMQSEIDMLQAQINNIEKNRKHRHESRKHLSLMHQPMDATAHRHEGETISRNTKRIAELQAKIDGARQIEIDLLHWNPHLKPNKEILQILHNLQEKVMRHNFWENIVRAIKHHCFHDTSGWHFLMEFCCLTLSTLDEKDLRLTRGGWDQTELNVPEYISYWYGESCKSCGAKWAQTCRGECRSCGHKNGWPEHYTSEDAEKRKTKPKKAQVEK
jgi:hypothetical protein